MDISEALPGLKDSQKKIWVETTTLEHGHGGTEFWAFGRALWSPSRDKAGKDIYALMRQVKNGDLVLHLLKGGGGQLAGYSRAAGPFEEILKQPPIPGAWANRSAYYRIPLTGYTQLEAPVSIKAALKNDKDAFQAILKSGRYRLFYCQRQKELRLNQGKYLTQVSPELYELLGGLFNETELKKEEKENSSRYREGRERIYIQTARERNPKVRANAIARYGHHCMVCKFDFDYFYGPDLAIGYIEVHHLNPLASLTEETETDLKDLIVVCSNCHRIIHRKKGETMNWKFLRREISKRRKS